MNFKTYLSLHHLLRHCELTQDAVLEELSLGLLARLNRCVTMMMPGDITLTLHSIEYVNAGFNFLG